MKTKHKRYVLALLASVVVSLLLCLILSKYFDAVLSPKDMFVMAGILIVLKLMSKVLNSSFFTRFNSQGVAKWIKQVAEGAVVVFCLIFILSGLSLIGYNTISFTKSLLLVAAAVPGIEMFLFLRRYIVKMSDPQPELVDSTDLIVTDDDPTNVD